MMALSQRVVVSLGKDATGWVPTLSLALVSSVVVLLPIGGLLGGRWLFSLFPNPSIPLIALLFSWVLKNAFQLNFLDMKAIQACRGFSLLAGAALYPMAMGVGAFDPYAAGWHFSWLFVILPCVTLLFLFFKNRFSVVLLATILAYDLHLLESGNLWDYLVDPILVLAAIVGLIVRMFTA